MDHLWNLLLPETDAGVLIQLLLVLTVWQVALWLFWQYSEMRLVTIGAGVVALGLMDFEPSTDTLPGCRRARARVFDGDPIEPGPGGAFLVSMRDPRRRWEECNS